MFALQAVAQDHTPDRDAIARAHVKQEFSPYVGRTYPTRVLWGETHLHTAVSVDAGTMCTIGQEDAFRFGRGEEVTSTGGLRAKLSRPLDFIVISDHAEMYGLMPQLLRGDPEILKQEKGRKWYDALTSGDADVAFATAMEIVGTLSLDDPPIRSEKVVKSAWKRYTALADQYNEPGRFTRRPAPASSSVSSAAGSSRRNMHSHACPPESATPRAFRWAVTSRSRRAARRQHSWSRR